MMGDFFERSVAAAGDAALRGKLATATGRQFAGRIAICKEIPDVDGLRELGARIRNHVLANLDGYLRQLTDRLTAAGVRVHFAEDAAAARAIVGQIAREKNIRRVVKSKSMATEEIELNPALEAMGLEVTETDLGEYIIQVAGQKPGHLVTPAIHLSTQDIAELFREKLGYTGPADPTAMTKFARDILRAKFRAAEMGISGVNFAVADPGLITICTNEGNGRYVTTWPKVYVAVMGMERLVPDLASASVIFKLLARFSTGQRMTQYATLTRGPGGADGPSEVHLIILDNGRSEILGSRYWEILRCIRCGSCLNGCPVFRSIGGHAYGGPYSGPIGAALLPLLYGLGHYGDLPRASSLCGLCQDICPMKIPIPDLLLDLRDQAVREGRTAGIEKLAMEAWATVIGHPGLFKLGQRVLPWVLKPISRQGWLRWLPGPSGGWTKVRDFPMPARETFLRSVAKNHE